MQKLGKKINPIKQTIEAYACSCKSCGCYCGCSCAGTDSTPGYYLKDWTLDGQYDIDVASDASYSNYSK